MSENLPNMGSNLPEDFIKVLQAASKAQQDMLREVEKIAQKTSNAEKEEYEKHQKSLQEALELGRKFEKEVEESQAKMSEEISKAMEHLRRLLGEH